eukprot:9348780-Pyramimonas_sp.AAC.1
MSIDDDEADCMFHLRAMPPAQLVDGRRCRCARLPTIPRDRLNRTKPPSNVKYHMCRRYRCRTDGAQHTLHARVHIRQSAL